MDLGHIHDVAGLRLYVSEHLGTPLSHTYVYGQEVSLREEETLGGTGPATLPVSGDTCTLCTSFHDVHLNMLRTDELATHAGALGEFKDHPYVASHSDISSGRLINPTCPDVVALSTPSHELLYISDWDSIGAISQVVERRFKHEELTILCPQFTGPTSKGGLQMQPVGDVWVSLHLLQELGLEEVALPPPSPLWVCTMVRCCVMSLQPGVEKPSQHSLDPCVFDHQIVLPDMSAVCIEFQGALNGRRCRVLLDSGSSSDFVSDTFVAEMGLPRVPLVTPVVVSYADGGSKVATHREQVVLTIGTVQQEFCCTPTTLAFYDVVLGKPWLTKFNSSINWELNTVAVLADGVCHVLEGAPRGDLPEYVISAVKTDKLIHKGTKCFIVEINS